MPTFSEIFAEARDLCDADSTSYPDTQLTRRVKAAYEKVIGWILGADGLWQWDDTNYDDFPIGAIALAEGQSKYSFNDKFLDVYEVSVRKKDGDLVILKPIDQKEYSDHTPLSEAFPDAGLPIYYDKIADDTFELYPAPSATEVDLSNIVATKETGGLVVKYKRTGKLENVGDNSNVPGFISLFHEVLAYMVAIPYCMSYKKDRVGTYRDVVGDYSKPIGYKKAIIEQYSRREKDKRKQVTLKQRAYK